MAVHDTRSPDTPRDSCAVFLAATTAATGCAPNTQTHNTQVLLENYLMIAAAIQNQNAGRLPDMLKWVLLCHARQLCFFVPGGCPSTCTPPPVVHSFCSVTS